MLLDFWFPPDPSVVQGPGGGPLTSGVHRLESVEAEQGVRRGGEGGRGGVQGHQGGSLGDLESQVSCMA